MEAIATGGTLVLALLTAAAVAFMMARASTPPRACDCIKQTPIPGAQTGETPERLLAIQLVYRDTSRTRAVVTIKPGEDITVTYETGALFRIPRDPMVQVQIDNLDKAIRNIAGIPYQDSLGPISVSSRAAPGAGSGSSKRHSEGGTV